MKIIHSLLALAFLITLTATATEPHNSRATDSDALSQQIDSINILWIGNSYTYFNDLPQIFKEIAATQGVDVSNTRVLKGGEKLSGHLQNPILHEEMAKGDWDYVIIQEFSSTPALSTKYVAENVLPYAMEIDSLVHVYSPDAKTVYYMTWGHKNGTVRPSDYPLDDTYEWMQQRIANTYIDIAFEANAMCAPVGLAWKNVRKKHPEIELYTEDNFHPSLLGSYLAANTIFSTIFGIGYISTYYDEIDMQTAIILQNEAQRAVEENKELLNIK